MSLNSNKLLGIIYNPWWNTEFFWCKLYLSCGFLTGNLNWCWQQRLLLCIAHSPPESKAVCFRTHIYVDQHVRIFVWSSADVFAVAASWFGWSILEIVGWYETRKLGTQCSFGNAVAFQGLVRLMRSGICLFTACLGLFLY